MKNRLPYIIGALALVALILLVIGAPRENEQKFDERISLRQKDKIPYGTYAAQQLLSSLFPDAAISTDKAEPGYWADLDTEDSNQLVILVAKTFNAEKPRAETAGGVCTEREFCVCDRTGYFLYRVGVFRDQRRVRAFLPERQPARQPCPVARADLLFRTQPV